ncbi:hypothetical protein G9F73_013985 [Clostridium estertheticum]|uniref:hypothetical protein n=1 Tax=Clostridium estertheticum TaxID=238834 RepID=UPI0013EE4D8D|nr:hypothetical protein [Clostridium estertheticum]MBZ9608910.1 hypothetical protein [Clostridium estertheticum]
MDKVMEILQNNIGFSWKGLIVFLLPMLPNILFFILKDPNGSTVVTNKHFLLDIIEHGSQTIFFALLIFGVSKKVSPILCGYTIFMLIILLSYYGFWIAYFTIGTNFIMIISMAVFPVIYFILAEIWLHNLFAIVPLTIFGIAHTIITYIDYYSSY